MYLEQLVNEFPNEAPVIRLGEFGVDEEGNKLFRASAVVKGHSFAARHNDSAQAVEDCAMLVYNHLKPYDYFEQSVWGND